MEQLYCLYRYSESLRKNTFLTSERKFSASIEKAKKFNSLEEAFQYNGKNFDDMLKVGTINITYELA